MLFSGRRTSEVGGVCRVIRTTKNYSALYFTVVLTSLLLSLFEGGSIAILGAAVGVLADPSAGGTLGSLQIWLYDFGQRFFDKFDSQKLFLFLIVIAVLMQVLRSGLSYTVMVANNKLQTLVRRDMAADATLITLSMDYAVLSRYAGGKIATLIEQTKFLAMLVAQANKLIVTSFLMVAYVTVLFTTSFYAALLLLAGALVLWISTRGILKKLRNLSTLEAVAEIELWQKTVEFLNAPKMLQVFNTTGAVAKLVNDARHRMMFARMRGVLVQSVIEPVLESLVIVALGTAIVITYLVLGDGAAEGLPEIFVYLLVIVRVKPQIIALNQVRLRIAGLLPRIAVVEEFLATAEKSPQRTGGIQVNGLTDKIRFENVDFRYSETGVNVLNDITFEIPKRTTVAITGTSGAGKSTILDLIVGLYEPTKGLISIDGQDIKTIDLSTWRDRIGIVEQDFSLLNTSIKENLLFGRSNLEMGDIEAAAHMSASHDFIDKMENGYDTVIGDRGHRLSGGQCQRLGMSRALLRNPDLLILDEATSALDSESEKMIQNSLRTIHGNRTILMVTHRWSSLQLADWLIIVENGRIVEQGPCEALLRNSQYLNVAS